MDMQRRAISLKFTVPPGVGTATISCAYRGVSGRSPTFDPFTLEKRPDQSVSAIKTDLAPPLDTTFGYTVFDGGSPLPNPVTGFDYFDGHNFLIPSGGFAWVRTSGSPNITVALLMEGPPTLKYGIEAATFYSGAGYMEGRAVGASLPRRQPTVSVSFLTLSTSEAQRLRSLLTLNPLYFQWPAGAFMPVADEWYQIGDVDEVPISFGDATRRWTAELTPVTSQATKWTDSVLPHYYEYAYFFATYRDAAQQAFTYAKAQEYALGLLAPPLPRLEL
ncbi:hypothetical protein [Longispora fulva]|uniref:Uncharacterized protein n=1 Tax=Longispora fulva TaxID=619741 RepID=A0A8J7GJ82_9ACTN|nr:hypothetical protein [Longispora fulva]MBG6137528.1 hypothetical protein [Longispora fulva]